MSKTSRKIAIILFIGLIVATGYLVIKKRQSQTNNKQEKTEKQKIIENLSSQHNAKIDWNNKAKFTIEIQNEIVSDQPSIFIGQITDIAKENESDYLYFHSSPLEINSYILKLQIPTTIKSKLFDSVTSATSYFYNEYAIVARINKVQKPFFSLRGMSTGEEYEEVEVYLKESSFIGTGEIVDFKRLY